MTPIQRMRHLVANGLYCLTEHADEEARVDGFDIYDVENGSLTGRVRRSWRGEGKMKVVGDAREAPRAHRVRGV